MATQEQLNKLRTLTQQNGALIAQNDVLLNSAAKESTLQEVKDAVDNIKLPEVDLSSVAKEITLQQVKESIENIQLPEIDTTTLAKQGDNVEATNTAIYEAVQSLPDAKRMYSARFVKNDDGVDTYSMVLPVVAGVVDNGNGTVTIKM